MRSQPLRQLALPAWGGRNLAVLSAARLTLSATRGLVGVITPLYLARVGFSATRLGLLFVASAGVSAILSTLIGLYADQLGRRPFLIATPLLATVAGVAFAFSAAAPVLFVAAAAGSFGRGGGGGGGSTGPHRPAESAMVADSVSGRRRSDAFTRLAVLSALGALLGGLLARLADGHGSTPTAQYRPAFLAAAALAAVAGLVAVALREPARHRNDGGSVPVEGEGLPRRGRRGRRATFQWPRRSVWVLSRLALTNAVNGLAVGVFGPFVAYWFARRFGVGPGTVGTLFAAVNAVSIATIGLAGPCSRRFGLVRTVIATRVVQGALLIPLALAPTLVAAGTIYAVRMATQRVGLPLRQSFAVSMAHPEERASVAALSTLPMQATNSFSPLLAGYLFDEVSLAAPFLLGGALQLIAAALWGAFFRGSALPGEE